MKKTLGLIAFTSITVFAGDRFVGNGGDAIQCQVNEYQKTTELLDLFEGRTVYGYTYFNLGGNREEIINHAMDRLLRFDAMRYVKYLDSLMKLRTDLNIESNFELPNVDDSGVIPVTVGCQVLQVAVYRPKDNLLTVDSKLWDAMEMLDQGALPLHEIIWQEALDRGHTTSENARRFNAWLLSDQAYFATQADYRNICKLTSM